MKIRFLVGFALVTSSLCGCAANTDTVRFSGSVQKDSSTAAGFDVSIPAGQTSKFVFADGTALEFSAAASRGNPAQSIVRLLDASGKQLHSETALGNAPTVKSLSYMICGGRVTFMSPAPLKPASCGQS